MTTGEESLYCQTQEKSTDQIILSQRHNTVDNELQVEQVGFYY